MRKAVSMTYQRGLFLSGMYLRVLGFILILVIVIKTLGWIGVLGYSIFAYVYDVSIRRNHAAKHAIKLAKNKGKPLLNVGAGGGSLASQIFGPTNYGDVNIDIAAGNCSKLKQGRVLYGDIHYLPEFKDGEFGVAFSSHVLEHVTDPLKAWKELSRVANHVVVVSPSWWAPHTWFYLQHRWYIDEKLRVYPLWYFDASLWNDFYLDRGNNDSE